MAVQSPTRDQILDLASELGLDLSDEDVDSYIGEFFGPDMLHAAGAAHRFALSECHWLPRRCCGARCDPNWR